MSRIGKKPVAVPSNVKVSLNGCRVQIEGPKGKLEWEHRAEVSVKWEESEKSLVVSVDPSRLDERLIRALWGTTRAILRNMVEGVTKGYEKKLEVVGVGWTASQAGDRKSVV